MNSRRTTVYAIAAAGLVLLAVIGIQIANYTDLSQMQRMEAPEEPEGRSLKPLSKPAAAMAEAGGESGEEVFRFSDRVLRWMIAAMAEGKGAIGKEAVLRFRNEAAYLDFLANARANGVRLLGKSDALRSVRLGFDSYEDFAGLIDTLNPDDLSAESNYLVSIPLPPESGESPGAGDGAVPFGQGALAWLGVTGDHSAWGQGVKVAVLDSGVQEHTVFGDKVIREWTMVYDAEGNPLPVDPEAGHGTAVASIIGGQDGRLPGVAPASELLSFRVLDNNGFTDSFTLAEAIVAATDAGAQVINVSLGSSGDSLVVRDAVAYAMSNGALIVASTGNDGVGQVSYPAAIEGVVAVAASDARGEHLEFSNGGEQLLEGGLAAPGYGVSAAWPEEQATSFSGTSASTPYVSGAVAAVMSQYEGMTAQAAYQLLLQYSNEAGAPGADPLFGSGNLDIGRVMESETPGIVDVAVASYYYDPAGEGFGGADLAQVIIENRGTSALRNVAVEIDPGTGVSGAHRVSYLEAGETTVLQVPFHPGSATDGQLGVSASASVEGDRNLSDNTLQKVITVGD